MKTILLILSISLHLFAVSRNYQENVVNIEGQAKIKITPNIATIVIGVSASNIDPDSAILNCAQKFSTFMSLLKDFNFSDNDIKSTRFSVNKDWDYEDGKRVETGYVAKKMYKITIRDLSKLKNFLFQATTQGINSFEDLEFTHDKLDSLKRTVIDLAIDDANKMSQRVGNKMGLKIGKPILVSNAEPKEFSYENRVRINWISAPKFTKGGALSGKKKPELEEIKLKYLEDFFSINSGMIEIENKVYITYEIKR